MLRRTIELSLSAFLVAGTSAGFARPHLIFSGGAHYLPPRSRERADQQAWEELAGLGLAFGRELAGTLDDAIHVLYRPEVEYWAHVNTEGDRHHLLVAARGREAVVAFQQDGTVWLKPAREHDRARTLARNLPSWPAAEFLGFSVRRDEVTQPGGQPYEPPPARSQEARILDDVLHQPNHGFGQLHVASSDGGGRVPSTTQLTYLDLDAGRVGLELGPPDQVQHVTVFPGTLVEIAARLGRIRAALTEPLPDRHMP
ncbi:ESX secretion-associated protein EspG [Amycolatopsis cihanbeyliensis]|uniref:ESAT-6 protein secretion system EspG family protein n=1 Tax=Amycolatopsis cihanbeyliensis TaxID=1128664 RepID=A0A542DPD6_AMYCI|nr:ESX secretion-associated protein EspG [Amycolatopsis cihanbeyliensis]TQJ04927.1 ESAT-6 protein secretion system EspG family protein [Amycolatopsis cihanbeyliensis]